MANDIVNFESKVPAFLAANNASEQNADLAAHASGSFPVMSIKGKQFTIIRDGKEQLLMNPLDKASVAQYIDVVLLRVPKFTSKTYYAGAFNADAEVVSAPICFSSTGIIPDANASEPQCSSCAACPQNVWGSAKNPDGSLGKGKACRDNVRVAIAAPSALDDPLLLRVPPTSIKALGQLSSLLNRRQVPYNGVVVRISFDPKEVAQKLIFTPIAFVTQDQYAVIKSMYEDETVKAITGETPDVIAHLEQVQGNPIPAKPELAPVAAPAKPKRTVKKKETAADKAVVTGRVTAEAVKEVEQPKAPEPEVVETAQTNKIDITNLSFDD